MATEEMMADKDNAKAAGTEESPEAIQASEAARAGTPAEDVKRWLFEESHGTLCTTAAKKDVEGWPFGSVVPYALTADGRPLLLLAGIAAHTANLRRDNRATLFIMEKEVHGDPQAHWRIGILGKLVRVLAADSKKAAQHQKGEERTPGQTPTRLVDPQTYEALFARYLEKVPNADGYRGMHDFDLWCFDDITKVRYIAGFGKITWIDGDLVLDDPMAEGVAEVAPGAITHMNADHPHNLLEMCQGQYGIKAATAIMEGLERGGFFVRTQQPSGLFRFSFSERIRGEDVRSAVIQVLKRAR